MEFKTDKISLDWVLKPPPASLKFHAKLMDTARQLFADKKPLTITDFLREPTSKPSFHPKGQAYDMRTHDMAPEIRQKMLAWARISANLINERILKGKKMEIQVEPHFKLWDKPNEHFHIELDDKHPVSIEEGKDGT